MSFFLVIMREDDGTHDSMEYVLNWRWLGGQSHCYTFGVWRCFVRWWNRSIMWLIFVTFIQCEEVWGRGRGLNNMTRVSSFPTLRRTSSLFILCRFSWYIVRGYIQHFSWEYLKWFFFLASMKTFLVGMLTGLGNHLCSTQVVPFKGYVILDIRFWTAEKVVS